MKLEKSIKLVSNASLNMYKSLIYKYFKILAYNKTIY